jgi:poly(hydroxyalkanoate) granule-associated protein
MHGFEYSVLTLKIWRKSMVTKLKSSSQDKASAPHISGAMKESAQQIWSAGLGAFTKAQEGGGKVFETLVKEGLSIQRKTQSVAEEKISEATNKMAGMASDIATKATGQWGKLEDIFEDRVAKALNKLGVPSAKDVSALIERIDALSQAVQKLSGKVPAAPKAAAKAPKSAPKKVSKSVTKPATKPSVVAEAPPAAPKPRAKRAAAKQA